MQTQLIITIDTEEEGLWSDSFRATGNTVENVAGIPGFQAICDNHSLAPVYLVNTPVIDSDNAVKVLRTIHEQGRCEIGTHIHPWNTPPVAENITSEESYLCNLEESVQAQKLALVTEEIEQRFGNRPTAFRSGRYGIDRSGVKILEDLGYTVDSSVCPFTDYSGDGGPDFRYFPWQPYYVGADFSVASSATAGLLEVPVSFGYNWRNFERAFAVDERLGEGLLSRLRLRGILSRLNILNKIKFSPEKHDAGNLKTLARVYAAAESPCIVMMFHSSSLVAGFSPYVPTERSLTNFLGVIDEVVDYCLSTLGMVPNTLSGFAESYRS